MKKKIKSEILKEWNISDIEILKNMSSVYTSLHSAPLLEDLTLLMFFFFGGGGWSS